MNPRTETKLRASVAIIKLRAIDPQAADALELVLSEAEAREREAIRVLKQFRREMA